MCGILIEFEHPKLVGKYLKKIKHRGTTSKTLQHNHIGFGHARLAIQGLDKKYDQPWVNDKEIILFNGEIFNYKELNPQFKSDILLLEEGFDVSTFDGFFAIVKYEKFSEKIKVWTDKLGQKQLFYRLSDGKITGICSEIKGLVRAKDKPDYHYLAQVYKFGYSLSDRTAVENIKRFLPGKEYTITRQQIVSVKNLIFDSKKLCDEKKLYDMIDFSVRRRLVSDVPVSFLFSGGIDSSIILHHLLKYQRDIKVFTIKNNVDYEYAKKLSELWGFELNYLDIKQPDYDKIHTANESAVDLGSVIPNYLLFEAIAKQKYKVVLSGDVADELFGGYKRMKEFDCQLSDINDELTHYHFPRLDKLSMAHTVELRCPYAALYLLDFALSLPYKERIGKKFLKDAYRGIIPDFIIDREKMPLKIDAIRDNKEEERHKLVKAWEEKLFKRLKNGKY